MGRAGEGSLKAVRSALVHASSRGCSPGPRGPPGVSTKDPDGKQIPEQPTQGVQPSRDSPGLQLTGVCPHEIGCELLRPRALMRSPGPAAHQAQGTQSTGLTLCSSTVESLHDPLICHCPCSCSPRQTLAWRRPRAVCEGGMAAAQTGGLGAVSLSLGPACPTGQAGLCCHPAGLSRAGFPWEKAEHPPLKQYGGC